MKAFRYTGVDLAGKKKDGEAEAIDKAALERTLRDKDIYVIAAKEIDLTHSGRRVRVLSSNRSRELSHHFEALADLLASGVRIDAALGLVSKGKSSLQHQWTAIRDRVRTGLSLADAIEREGNTVGPAELAMIRAGELSGSLAQVIREIARSMERQMKFRDQIQSAMLYPAIVVVISIAAVVILLTTVVPQLAPLFEGRKELPFTTMVVLGVSRAFNDYWWALTAGLVLFGIVVRSALMHGKFIKWRDARILAAPVLGKFLIKIEAVRFFRAMHVMLNGGVGIRLTLSIALQVVSNKSVAAAIYRLEQGLRSGRSLSDGIMAEQSYFPGFTADLIAVGENSGTLKEITARLADMHDADIQRTINKIVVVLPAIVTIGLGLIVGLIVSSIMMAIMSANEVVG